MSARGRVSAGGAAPGRGPRAGLDARLVPAALAAWAAAAVLVAAPSWLLAATAASAAVLAAVLVARRRPGSAALVAAVVAGAVCAVAVSVLAAQVVRGAGLLRPLAAQGAVAVVEGSATADAVRVRTGPGAGGAGSWSGGQERWVVHLRAERVTGRGSASSARAAVLVVGGPAWRGVRRGDEVRAVGRLVATERSDPAAALLLPVRAPRVAHPRRGPARWGQRLRAGLADACTPLAPDPRGLLPGLVVGDTSRVPDDLDAALRSTGLTHLTAVSGGNTALVTSAVLAAASAAGVGRRARLLLACGALLGFAALAGGEPSVLRAAVMGATALVGAVASRGGGGLPALAVAVCALLVTDPWLARSAGFALSVVTTGALLVVVPAWSAGLAQRAPRLPRRLAGALVAPLVAQLACGPLVLLLAPGVPLLAVPANLLAVPAVAPATLLGLLATLLEPLWPPGARLAARAGGLGAAWVALVARAAAGVPGVRLAWPQGPLPALALAALSAAAVVGLRRAGRRSARR